MPLNNLTPAEYEALRSIYFPPRSSGERLADFAIALWAIVFPALLGALGLAILRGWVVLPK
jgi:hypothetical protein